MIVIPQLIIYLNLIQKPRECAELNIFLNEKDNKIKSILLINNILKNNNIEENDFSNDTLFSTNESLPTATDYSTIINFIKNIISHNHIDEDSTIERIIEYMKKIQMKEMEEKWFKLLDIRNSVKFNDDNDKLKIDKFQTLVIILCCQHLIYHLLVIKR